MHLLTLPLGVLLVTPPALLAAQLPLPSKSDTRIGYVTYNDADVVELRVQRGTVTRIILADDEKIAPNGVATGFLADCANTTSEWCIRADAGTNQILVKPKDNATHNNVELRTNKRDYSIALRVLPDAGRGGRRNTALHRVMFRYPGVPEGQARNGNARAGDSASDRVALDERLARARSAPRNWAYSMQVMPGAADFAPSLVYDDGRFTYFRFPANREIPTVYVVSAKGEESRVNFHMDEHDDHLLVVERTGRQFVLRLGTTAVGIWNDMFDPDGVATRHGTTVNGVMRDIRQGGRDGN